MRARLHTVGPSVGLLAQHLAENGWDVEAMGQYTTQRGWIEGSHENPRDFAGFGVSDGTRCMFVVILGDEDEDPR